MNLLIENGPTRLISTEIAIATVLVNPKTGKHLLYYVSNKGTITTQELPEGTTVLISVIKSKEPDSKAA